MGKKSHSKQSVITTREFLRHASNKLERHIFHANAHTIKQILEDSLPNISFTTYERGTDLLRETKKEAHALSRRSLNAEDSDSEYLQRQIRKKERLADQFQDKLERSMPSYERTYQIFRNTSLKEKFRHLLRPQDEEEEEKTDGPLCQLQKEEQAALSKIKHLYRRYRVSNMYKLNVVSKICQKYVQQLIKKGFIRQHNAILSLAC